MADEEDPELAAFVHAQWAPLVGALSLVTGDPAAAEETAQEALSRVAERWDRVRTMAAPGAYAHRIAVNLARRAVRQAGRRDRAVRRLSAGVAHPQPVDVPTTVDVRAAVATLPLRQRTAVVLRYYADLSVADTATAMGCRPGTVKSLTSQALAALRTAGLTAIDPPIDVEVP